MIGIKPASWSSYARSAGRRACWTSALVSRRHRDQVALLYESVASAEDAARIGSVPLGPAHEGSTIELGRQAPVLDPAWADALLLVGNRGGAISRSLSQPSSSASASRNTANERRRDVGRYANSSPGASLSGSSGAHAPGTWLRARAPLDDTPSTSTGGSSSSPRTRLDARAVTRDISTARSWVELAEVVAAAGGPAALNEIHLSAAISRLAKLDLDLDLTPVPNGEARGRSGGGAGNLGSGVGGSGRAGLFGGGGSSLVSSASGGGDGGGMGLAAGAMKGPAGALPPLPPSPPPPPPALGALPLSGFGPRPPTGPLPLSGVPPSPPSPPVALGLTQRMPYGAAAGTPGLSGDPAVAIAAVPAAATAAAAAVVDPAGTPHELCALLLDALARRFDGGTSTGRVGDSEAPKQGHIAQQQAPLPPPPPRVLANSVWGAVRLYLDLWPDQPAKRRQESERTAAVALRALLRHVPAAAVTRSLQPQHVSNLLYSLARLQQAAPRVLLLPTAAARSAGSGRRSETDLAYPASEQVVGGAEEDLQESELDAVALARALADAAAPMLLAQAQAAAEAPLAAAGRLRGRSSEDSFGAQALSNALWALAVLGVRPPRPWFSAWLRSSAGVLPAADPQHVSNMLWALARFQIQPGSFWIRAALQAAALKAPAFTPQGLCNTLWALAKLECADALLEMSATPTSSSSAAGPRRPLLLPLLGALRGAAAGCSGQDVANGMWALAQLRRLLPQAVRRRLQGARAEPAATADAIRAAARAVNASLQSAGEALLLRSARHLHSYCPQQLANTTWAAERLALQPPPEWAAALWPAATAALPAMRSEELVATAMAVVRLRLQPPAEWVERLLQVTWQMMEQDQAEEERVAQAQADAAAEAAEGREGREGSDEENEQSHARMLHGLPPVRASGRMLASLLWCMAAWRTRLPASWTAALLRRLEALAATTPAPAACAAAHGDSASGGCEREGEQEQELEPQQLAAVLQALARMRLRPDRLVRGWTRRVVEAHVRAQLAAAASASGTVDRGVEQGSRADARAPQGGSFGSYPDPQAARMILWAVVHLTDHTDSPSSSGSSSRSGVSGLPVYVVEALALSAAGCCGPAVAAGAGAATGNGTDAAHAMHGSSRSGSDSAVPAVQLPAANTLAEAEAVAAPRGASLALWALAAGVAAAPLAVASLRRLVAAAAAGLAAAGGRELASLSRSLSALGFRPGQPFRTAFERRLEVLLMAELAGKRQRPSTHGERHVEGPGRVSLGTESGVGGCDGEDDERVAIGERPGLTGAQAAAVLRGCAELRWPLPPKLAAELCRR